MVYFSSLFNFLNLSDYLSDVWFWGLLLINLGVSMFKRLSSFWVVLGFLFIGIGSSLWLSIWSLSLLLVVSLVGFSIILWLLRYFTMSKDLSFSGSKFTTISLLFISRFLVNCTAYMGFFNTTGSVWFSSSSFTYLSSILFSVYWLCLLCLLVWLATMLLIHMSTKVLYYNLFLSISLINYLIIDAFLLLILGISLCLFPIFMRKCLSFHSSYSNANIRELIFRWTSDTYECGISTTNTGFDEDMINDMNMGMLRLLSFVYLFLLLDLEASILLVSFYGGCIPIYILFFIFCVLLSLACELSKDPIT